MKFFAALVTFLTTADAGDVCWTSAPGNCVTQAGREGDFYPKPNSDFEDEYPIYYDLNEEQFKAKYNSMMGCTAFTRFTNSSSLFTSYCVNIYRN